MLAELGLLCSIWHRIRQTLGGCADGTAFGAVAIKRTDLTRRDIGFGALRRGLLRNKPKSMPTLRARPQSVDLADAGRCSTDSPMFERPGCREGAVEHRPSMCSLNILTGCFGQISAQLPTEMRCPGQTLGRVVANLIARPKRVSRGEFCTFDVPPLPPGCAGCTAPDSSWGRPARYRA